MASEKEDSGVKSGAKEILSQIFSRIGELSNALSVSDDGPSKNTGSTSNVGVINSTVENEVRRVFGRQSSTTSKVETSNTKSKSCAAVAHSTPLYNSRKYFGNPRSAMNSAKSKRTKKSACPSRPFTRDVILLSGPDEKDIPRQGSKVFLQEHGHIISAFEFRKEWSDIDVELEIRQAFQETLPDDVEFEIVHSVHTTLLKPTLAPGQYLTGAIINHVFGNNKPVYVRPSRQILHPPKKEKRQRHDLPSNVFEDDDDDYPDELATNDKCFELGQENKYQLVKPVEPAGEIQVPNNYQAAVEVVVTEEETSSLIEHSNLVQPDVSALAEQEIASQIVHNNINQDQQENDEGFLQDDSHWSNDAQDISTRQAEENMQFVKEIAIHRSNVLKDMIMAFKDSSIFSCRLEIVFIDDRGNIEDGRGSGVQREALSIFWREFYNSLATGASEKVPSIRHDHQKDEWQSIARVLVIGFARLRYFPVTLSRAFVASCLFPEETLPMEWLLESFHRYISKDDSETLKRSLTAECPEPSADDEVLDVLSSYKCHRVVTKDNMPKIIDELAHQELIQRPKYIANAWSPILEKLKRFKEFENVESLVNLYEAKKPTHKKVCKLLTSNPATDAQRECFSYLKRFVKSFDDNLLTVFLQFVTGSNVIAVDKIEVAFSEESGKGRRPVAHTCGPLLLIPSTYQSYNELSEEFSNIFRRSAEWSFYIV